MPQGNISRLERGDIQDVMVSTLLDLAHALGVDAMTLLQPLTTTQTQVSSKSPRRRQPAPVA